MRRVLIENRGIKLSGKTSIFKIVSLRVRICNDTYTLKTKNGLRILPKTVFY